MWAQSAFPSLVGCARITVNQGVIVPKSVELIWGSVATVGMGWAMLSIWREERRNKSEEQD